MLGDRRSRETAALGNAIEMASFALACALGITPPPGAPACVPAAAVLVPQTGLPEIRRLGREVPGI
jgi:hypothetical protein